MSVVIDLAHERAKRQAAIPFHWTPEDEEVVVLLAEPAKGYFNPELIEVD